jgi:hypothetical protein
LVRSRAPGSADLLLFSPLSLHSLSAKRPDKVREIPFKLDPNHLRDIGGRSCPDLFQVAESASIMGHFACQTVDGNVSPMFCFALNLCP